MSKEDISSSTICANCGKDGANNVCAKCKQVMYCNAVCKKVHKKKHKKDCEEYNRLAAENHNEELKRAAELHDKKLFKQPPSQFGDCPICFIRIPSLPSGSKYMVCCGKTICSGCIFAPVYDDQGNEVDNHKCAFCRSPHPKSNEESNEREKKRMEADDAIAMHNLAFYYFNGTNGYPQDYDKALELLHRAADLGYAAAYIGIGYAYDKGQGVEVDKKKAIHYYKLGAIAGDEVARHNLGNDEAKAGNMDRALKHFMIAVRSGQNESLEKIKELYTNGRASKDDYTNALQAYQEYLGEIKSVPRDKAAAAADQYLYY